MPHLALATRVPADATIVADGQLHGAHSSAKERLHVKGKGDGVSKKTGHGHTRGPGLCLLVDGGFIWALAVVAQGTVACCCCQLHA
jgi:hypothetical protein